MVRRGKARERSRKGWAIVTAFCLLVPFVYTGCSSEKNAQIMWQDVGDCMGGDVTGGGLRGGTKEETRSWYNYRARAEVNMDITAAGKGTLTVILKDANGNEVFSQTLSRKSGDDTFSGVSTSGTPGTWTITVRVEKFKGDGSFSVCPGA